MPRVQFPCVHTLKLPLLVSKPSFYPTTMFNLLSTATYVSTLVRPLQVLISQAAILAYSSCSIFQRGIFQTFEALHLTSGALELKKLVSKPLIYTTTMFNLLSVATYVSCLHPGAPPPGSHQSGCHFGLLKLFNFPPLVPTLFFMYSYISFLHSCNSFFPPFSKCFSIPVCGAYHPIYNIQICVHLTYFHVVYPTKIKQNEGKNY